MPRHPLQAFLKNFWSTMYKEFERVAGLEPATSGLEDQRSTKWAILASNSPSRIWTYDHMINSQTLYPWAIEESRKKQDSNLRCCHQHAGLASQYFKPLSHFSRYPSTLKNINTLKNFVCSSEKLLFFTSHRSTLWTKAILEFSWDSFLT